MIDKRVASAQVDRLAGLNWYPRDGAPQIELIMAVEAAENEFIASYVVDQWLHYQTESPKPAELRALIWTENEKLLAVREEERQERLSERGAHCPACHDFGIVESIPDAPIQSVCSYCTCAAGRRRIPLAALSKVDPRCDHYPPEVVNAARAKLLKLNGKNATLNAMIQKTAKTKIFGDDYQGDF